MAKQPQPQYPGLIPLYEDYYMQIGQAAFSGTNTSASVRTQLTEVVATVAIPQTYTGSATAGGHVMFTSGAVSNGAVTFKRKANVDSGLKFFYILIGRVIA